MKKIKRTNFKEFKEKALQNSEVKKEYESLEPIFKIKKELIKARISKGLTQEQIAKKIGTSKSNISRLESLNNTYAPNLTTLIKYVNALGFKFDFRLE